MDADGDGDMDIANTNQVEWLFLGSATSGCLAITNVNGVAEVDISDPIWVLEFLFLGSPPPVEPFPERGASTSDADSELGC